MTFDKTKESICQAILRGEMTDKYEEWRHSPDKYVRRMLAVKGYWPEQFVNDKYNYVRVAVLHKHPEYVHTLLQNPINHADIGWFVNDKTDPDMQILKALQKTNKEKDPNPRTLDLKIKAMETEHTPLTLTMNQKQLFESGSPLWAQNLSIKLIHAILVTMKQAQDQGLEDELMDYFNQLCKSGTFYLTRHDIATNISLKLTTDVQDITQLVAQFL